MYRLKLIDGVDGSIWDIKLHVLPEIFSCKEWSYLKVFNIFQKDFNNQIYFARILNYDSTNNIIFDKNGKIFYYYDEF